VLEAAVVGMPHEKWGEAPHAFIVVRRGRRRREELREFCRAASRALQGAAAFNS
jgi:fatty-acyl-CoA synthase